jgi:F-type H+-transporting ATPase subunit alpha
MKKISGSLRLDLASARELEAFAQLGTELDKATQRQLDRGRRFVELLKQGQYTPFLVTDQIISIFAGAKGFLDDIPVVNVRAFENGLLEYFRTVGKATRDELDLKKALDAELEKKLEAGIKEFKAGFVVKK